MAMLKVDGVTHWSIPVNDLEEAEKFYSEVLGLTYVGRLGDSGLSCVTAGSHSILLCRRNEPVVRTPEQDNRLHHAFGGTGSLEVSTVISVRSLARPRYGTMTAKEFRVGGGPARVGDRA